MGEQKGMMVKPFHYIHLYPFLEITTKCHRYGVQIRLFAKAQQLVVENHHAVTLSHNSPLHYHNFAQHTIVVTQLHTSLSCANTTSESTMHRHTITATHNTISHKMLRC